MRYFISAIIVLSLLSIYGTAFAGQPGYKVCAQLSSDDLRDKCLTIVKSATRQYPKEVVDFIAKISDKKLEVLRETNDYVYPREALAACDADFSNDATRLIRCLKSAGNHSTKYGTYKSPTRETSSRGWILGTASTAAEDLQASTRCPSGEELKWVKQYNGDPFYCNGMMCSNGECWKCKGSYYCTRTYIDYSEVR
mgnify:FL=1